MPTSRWCSRSFLLALRDRKSTRLNSSHLGISYAVFCLKKNERVKGLDMGAADYLWKPFAFVELGARVRLLRSRGQPTPEKLQVSYLTLYFFFQKVAPR